MSAAAGSITKIARPSLMRGLMVSRIKKVMVAATLTSLTLGTSWWYFVARQRKINYEEFYKTYDIEKDYARMKAAGIFKNFK